MIVHEVRHPLERLLSAYRHVFERETRTTGSRVMGLQEVRREELSGGDGVSIVLSGNWCPVPEHVLATLCGDGHPQ